MKDRSERRRVFLINAVSSVYGGGIPVAQRISEGMARLKPEHRFLLYYSHPQIAETDYPDNVERIHLPALRSRGRRWLWEQLHLPRIAKGRGVDAVLQLGGYASFRLAAPQVSVWQNLNVFGPSENIPRPLAERIYIGFQRRTWRRSMGRAVQNIFLTETSIRHANDRLEMDRYPHRHIHSGVDPLPGEPAPLEGREPLALSIGHTFFHKNYEAMIDAMGEYRDRYDDPLRLEILGGPYHREYFASLERRIRERGLEDRVSMEGAATREKVLDRLSRARVYVVTSRLETFGLTLLEAMSAGLPVVASNATCHPEVCRDAAIYCDLHSPADIAARMHEVATDRALQERLRERGFARLEHFTWERSARSYLDELEKAAAGASTH